MCPPNYCTHLTELRAVPGGRRVTESEPAACTASTRWGAMRPAAPGTPPTGVGFWNTATNYSGDTFVYTYRHTSDAATQRQTAVASLLNIHADTHRMLQHRDTLQWRHFCIYIQTHIGCCNTETNCSGDTFFNTHRHTSDVATQRHTAVATNLYVCTDTHLWAQNAVLLKQWRCYSQ